MDCFRSLRHWLGNGLAVGFVCLATSTVGAAAPVPTEHFHPDDCGLFKLRVSAAAARCGHVSVPLRHGDPGSPRIRLGVVVVPAADAARRQPDPLFLAQGGPGGSTIGTFAQALIDDWIEQALGTAVPALEAGARGGTRTRTLFRAADFKSATSTGFVTRAGCPA